MEKAESKAHRLPYLYSQVVTAAPPSAFRASRTGKFPKNLQGPSVRNPGGQFDGGVGNGAKFRSGERTAKLDTKLGSCQREPYVGLLFLVADIVNANCLA